MTKLRVNTSILHKTQGKANTQTTVKATLTNTTSFLKIAEGF
jgi:hypothetical protein